MRQLFFIYFCNLVKSVAEANRLLVEAYDEAALSKRSYLEWFYKFESIEVNVEDIEYS